MSDLPAFKFKDLSVATEGEVLNVNLKLTICNLNVNWDEFTWDDFQWDDGNGEISVDIGARSVTIRFSEETA